MSGKIPHPGIYPGPARVERQTQHPDLEVASDGRPNREKDRAPVPPAKPIGGQGRFGSRR